ncbi:hypothetical protein KKG41_00275 [Patescibacteria group bacterium]|nr:hypothetical protein [Patescibacteria group bacterium]MBU1890083.1 hypothetical protein [Patescibacteria group bacterium]
MKNSFKEVLSSRTFDSVLAFLLFFFLALSFDYSTDEVLTGRSLMFDLFYSILLGTLVYFRPTNKGLSKEVLKDRSEKVEVIGKIMIGLLLFMIFLALTVYKLR